MKVIGFLNIAQWLIYESILLIDWLIDFNGMLRVISFLEFRESGSLNVYI